VAVVLTLVQTKQMRINVHKRNNTKHSTNNTKHSTNNKKHSKYKYTYYQNTHTYTRPHITKQPQDKLNLIKHYVIKSYGEV
jgi:hypothetical protein